MAALEVTGNVFPFFSPLLSSSLKSALINQFISLKIHLQSHVLHVYREESVVSSHAPMTQKDALHHTLEVHKHELSLKFNIREHQRQKRVALAAPRVLALATQIHYFQSCLILKC